MFGLLGIASTMGMHMISGPLVGGGLGWLIDHWLDSWPVGFGIGILLGIVAGFRNVWADAKRLERGQAEIDAARAAEQAARAEAALSEDGRRHPRVPKRPLLPEDQDETPPARDGDENAARAARDGATPPDAATAWEAYAELKRELNEEAAASDGADAGRGTITGAAPGRKSGDEPGRTS